MATVTANLFVDNEGNTLLYNQLGGTPAIPAMVAGDTLALSVYYLDRGSGSSPFRGHRYASSSTTVRLRAQGNNHVYATGTSGAEIAPTTGAVITTTVNGAGSTIAKKLVTFGSAPFTGFFKMTFIAPNTCRGNDPANKGMFAPHGTTAPISINATAAEIASAINALSWQKYDEHGDRVGGLVNPLPFAPAQFVISSRTTTTFVIEYGTNLYAGASGTLCNPQAYQLSSPSPALPTIDVTNVEFAFGWNVSVPMTDGDFTDLFLLANAPAYLEVLLTPSGGSQAYAGQYTLESSGGGSGGPPYIPPVGGAVGGEGGLSLQGHVLDGDYGYASAVGGARIEYPFPQSLEARIYRQTYEQAQPVSPIALDSICPHDTTAYLVEETEQQDMTLLRVVRWDRVWARVPPTRVEPEIVNYPYQRAYQDAAGRWVIISAIFTRTARVTYTYHHTADPLTIALARLPRLFVINGSLDPLDGATNLSYGAVTIARDDTLRRWMGNIWEKTHAVVTI